jgi:hypothetical protein
MTYRCQFRFYTYPARVWAVLSVDDAGSCWPAGRLREDVGKVAVAEREGEHEADQQQTGDAGGPAEGQGELEDRLLSVHESAPLRCQLNLAVEGKPWLPSLLHKALGTV